MSQEVWSARVSAAKLRKPDRHVGSCPVLMTGVTYFLNPVRTRQHER
jgi:hypothetical protein